LPADIVDGDIDERREDVAEGLLAHPAVAKVAFRLVQPDGIAVGAALAAAVQCDHDDFLSALTSVTLPAS
jgi:hypothetical protein